MFGWSDLCCDIIIGQRSGIFDANIAGAKQQVSVSEFQKSNCRVFPGSFPATAILLSDAALTIAKTFIPNSISEIIRRGLHLLLRECAMSHLQWCTRSSRQRHNQPKACCKKKKNHFMRSEAAPLEELCCCVGRAVKWHLDEAMMLAAPLNGLLNGTLGTSVLLGPPVCLLWPQLKCVLCKPAALGMILLSGSCFHPFYAATSHVSSFPSNSYLLHAANSTTP